ncbi:uncharacterized protein METZ01_LOCUS177717 [marine metagenome]|uniref:Uncharacterized protein n=1 Tax=marine metagenome TaxID=408172 RepID=A0A382CHL7_9ZZZZ
MDIRGYKPADETYYSYRDEEETPRAIHNEKVDDEDLKPSTVGRYASGEDFKHWPFKVGNAMTQSAPDEVQHDVDTGASSGYSTMNEFMEEDGAKEQAWVERENQSVFSIAISNWFGLKGYIRSFLGKKES